MRSRLTWAGDRTFNAVTEDGHAVTLGNAHGDTAKPGPSAMELVLIGAGGCSAYDIVSILEKSRSDIEDVIVELEATRADEPPKVFTHIHMHFIVNGRDLREDRVKRAIELSVEKYCSATAMLEKTAKVTHDFEIIAS